MLVRVIPSVLMNKNPVIDGLTIRDKNVLLNVQFSQQLVSQCHCETSCWRIAQCNMGCLAIFLLHEVELRCTFRNGLQQLTTPLQCITPPATCLAILRQF